MRRRRWFLPETPDLLAMLDEQVAITVEGMQALVAWAGGDAAAVDRLRDCEHRADDSQARAPCRTDHCLHDAARARGHLRALARARPGAEQREERRARGGSDADVARQRDRGDGRRARRRGGPSLRCIRRARQGPGPQLRSPPRRLPGRPRARAGSSTSTGERCPPWSWSRTCARWPRNGELYRRLARTSEDLREVAERVWYSVLKES